LNSVSRDISENIEEEVKFTPKPPFEEVKKEKDSVDISYTNKEEKGSYDLNRVSDNIDLMLFDNAFEFDVFLTEFQGLDKSKEEVKKFLLKYVRLPITPKSARSTINALEFKRLDGFFKISSLHSKIGYIPKFFAYKGFLE